VTYISIFQDFAFSILKRLIRKKKSVYYTKNSEENYSLNPDHAKKSERVSNLLFFLLFHIIINIS
jgi:hypothetical protein